MFGKSALAAKLILSGFQAQNCIFHLYLRAHYSYMKKNVPILGFLMGLFLPLIGLLIVYKLKFNGVGFSSFMRGFFADGKIAAKILMLSILINLIPFVYYTNKRLDHTAKGIFVVTMIYVVFILYLMYVWN